MNDLLKIEHVLQGNLHNMLQFLWAYVITKFQGYGQEARMTLMKAIKKIV